MDFSSINWWAVVTCVLVSMISGSIWYNPMTFFPAWWKVIGGGKREPNMENMGITWTLTVISSAVQAMFFALVIGANDSSTATSGALIGFMLWIGLIAPTYLVNKLFAGHGIKIWAIEAGNHLVNFVAFGIILSLWK